MGLIKPKAAEQSGVAQTSTTNSEAVDAGTKERKALVRDKEAYTEDEPGFPTYTPARTTFYGDRIADEPLMGKRWDTRTHKFGRLWTLQHGRSQSFEDWDDSYRVRPETAAQYRRARLVIAGAGLSGQFRDAALQKVMTENINGFNRYYRGVIGAALGFAALYRYETVAEAMDSYLADVAQETFDVDAEGLFEYVWQKYGGDR